jgi:O-antigen ligase
VNDDVETAPLNVLLPLEYNEPVVVTALCTVFVIYGLVEKRSYPLWLTSAVGLCIAAALAVSGSRSTVAMAAIVAAMFVVALLIRPSLIGKAMKLIGIVLTLAFLAGSLAVFQSVFDEGLGAFKKRMQETESVEGGFAGFVHRFTSTFTKPVQFMFDMPMLGYGLGVGTNVGAKLLTGQTDFVLAEDEWERVICESGAFLGGAFILIRLLMTFQLGAMAARAARIGHFLPLLLLGACGVSLVTGQFGQSTTLGFACFTAGLCLASMRLPVNVAAAVIAAKQPAQKLPAKVLAMRAAIEARRNAARGSSWTQKVLDQST